MYLPVFSCLIQAACLIEVAAKAGFTVLTVKTLNIGTPTLTTVVVLNIKQFNFTMK